MRGLKTLKLENGAALRGGSMGSQGCRTDLKGWRISDLKVRRHRTSRGGARTLSDTPIGPMAPPLEVRGGTNFETKIDGFWAPPTKMSYTIPHYYPKYEVKAIDFFV